MAYRITYGENQSNQSKPVKINWHRFRIITAVFLLSFVLLVKTFWPEGTSKIQSVLFADRLTETQQALDQYAVSVVEGKSFQDALTAFCRQLMLGENEG